MTYTVKDFKTTYRIEDVIRNNNRINDEYIKKVQAHNAKVQKALKDRENGIAPDPAFLKQLRDELIEAGILEKTGGLTAPYRREE